MVYYRLQMQNIQNHTLKIHDVRKIHKLKTKKSPSIKEIKTKVNIKRLLQRNVQ